jgi:hypothetical protein
MAVRRAINIGLLSEPLTQPSSGFLNVRQTEVCRTKPGENMLAAATRTSLVILIANVVCFGPNSCSEAFFD